MFIAPTNHKDTGSISSEIGIGREDRFLISLSHWERVGVRAYRSFRTLCSLSLNATRLHRSTNKKE